MSLAELGNSLRCEKDSEFAAITRQDLHKDKITLFMECPKCGNKFRNVYSVEQYTTMAEMALIDPPQIMDFQKKMVLENGELPRFDKGMQGIFVVNPNTIKMVQHAGQALLCKCNNFYALSVKQFKKDKVLLTGYCHECAPKGQKIKLKTEEAIELGQVGLISQDVFAEIKKEYRELMKGFNASETYRGNDGTLSTWAQERLGMSGESKRVKCYICGASLPEDANRCPKCGSDVDI